MLRKRSRVLAIAVGIVVAGMAVIGISESGASSSLPTPSSPIHHLVVIFDENVSFDHYFGTYPTALNPPGEPQFKALPGTPDVNGLSQALLDANPNLNNPQRLDPSQALTCDQNHGYTAEQEAFDAGLMDHFVQDTTGSGCTQTTFPDSSSYGPNGIVMDYYDGNTVTGLWNLAQHFSMNDNAFGTTFGPSSPGAINVTAANTAGAVAHGGTTTAISNGTLISDGEPYYDLCSNASTPLNTTDTGASNIGSPGGVTISMSGKNIGNLMNSAGVTWGWFQGGYTPSSYSNGRPICGTAHTNIGGASVTDYVEHHDPFQFYESTANPFHNSPSSPSEVGYTIPADSNINTAVNHQYDLSYFTDALNGTDGATLPQVSYLKPPAYENGHAGNSDPLDEQRWIVDTINQIEESKYWPNTAIVVTYDDSDGWYDHQMGPIITPSNDPNNDALYHVENSNDQIVGTCSNSASYTPVENDRCGVGPRLPFLVISPWAKQNYVDNTFIDQSSVVSFIEDNWNLGRIGGDAADATAGTLDNMFDFGSGGGHTPAIIMDPNTGEITKVVYADGSTYRPPQNSTGTAAYVPPSGFNDSGASSGSTGDTHSSTTGSTSKRLTVTCSSSDHAGTWRLKCATARTPGRTLMRARIYRGKRLRANKASVLHAGKASFSFKLDRGRYKLVLSVDDSGKVTEFTKQVKVR